MWKLVNDVRTFVEEIENTTYILGFVEFAKTCEQRVV